MILPHQLIIPGIIDKLSENQYLMREFKKLENIDRDSVITD